MKEYIKILNKASSILILLMYLFGTLSIFSLHNHDSYHDFSCVESACKDLCYDTDCSHASHIVNLKERCIICDDFSNAEPEILHSKMRSNIKLVSINKDQLFVSFYLYDSTVCLNKSPPFII